jgi:hypothetical protein
MLATTTFSQSFQQHKDSINVAKAALANSFAIFNSSIIDSSFDKVTSGFISKINKPYEQYLVAGVLFEMDASISYQLHKKAFLSDTNNIYFMLEFAIELHRNKEFLQALQLYQKYISFAKEDVRIYAWLADCFINTNQIAKAKASWQMANYKKNHTTIDFAICTIHGNTNQIKKRSELRNEIAKGNANAALDLIFLDYNWQQDWWNTSQHEVFLKADVALIRKNFTAISATNKLIEIYTTIKKLDTQNEAEHTIRKYLNKNKTLLHDYYLPSNGKIVSDILRICFKWKIIDIKEYYLSRGEEILMLAKKLNDSELLNIYAYLQSTTTLKIDASIDLLGWHQMKDKRFAISYFIGKNGQNKSTDLELKQAIKDFETSSKLYWIFVNCAKVEGQNIQLFLPELIKKEFMSLETDPNNYAYTLNTYFSFLH